MNNVCVCDNCKPIYYVDDFSDGVRWVCLKCNKSTPYIYQQIKEEEVGNFTKKLIALAKKAMSR